MAMSVEPATVADAERLQFSPMRRRIAKHMLASKSASPHVGMGIEIDYQAVDAVRTALRSEWREREGFGLSYLPFVARAVCLALADHPLLNAAVDGDALLVHRRVHLGIAVDLDFEGLIVPVIKDADERSVADLAREIRRLSQLARNRDLAVDDVTGGTYTISNPGPFGTTFTIPIINQPQVAILSTDGVRPRPWVVRIDESEQIVVRPVGLAIQSFDHRAVDGAYSASFLNQLRTIIETADWQVELGFD
ncbi:MAG: 2-oxo acid dehydrogenase subunit E2 [Acidimicrobiales bacterium]|nr:2-oxo acid dehydrogenase subunit E2 [Acidimicrobiales bacterium]